MLDFKKITESDFSVVDKYFSMHRSKDLSCRFCDYAPGTVKMWHKEYGMEYATVGDVMYLRAHYEEEGGTSYLMPVGNWDRGSLALLFEHIKGEESAVLSCMPEKILPLVKEVFSLGDEQLFADRDWADYLYLRKDICEPSGKRHHNYKNKLNRFKKENPEGAVVLLNGSNCREAAEFFKTYCEENPESSSVEDGEYRATLPVILDPEAYSMTGALLCLNDEIIGLTLGEIYNDTVIVHTEKARKDITGAYQTLARGYQLMMPESVKYVNREEDMGLEGLRRSKLSYSPASLEFKYTAVIK